MNATIVLLMGKLDVKHLQFDSTKLQFFMIISITRNVVEASSVTVKYSWGSDMVECMDECKKSNKN